MLASLHQELSSVLPAPLEPLAAAQCVEQHRFDWRPEDVHTLLLAESHVYTPEEELRLMQGRPGLTTRKLNQTFARFVYCLGYGEHEFAGPTLPPTTGTPQYWKLFASCVFPPSKDAFHPLLKRGNPSLLDRLRSKLSLLEELRALGVWLVDASAVALYRPGGTRPPDPVCQTVLKRSWHAYTGALVHAAKPHSIVVVGKGVARALNTELSALRNVEVSCVSQPQGCRRTGQLDEVFATLHQVCQHAARARGAR